MSDSEETITTYSSDRDNDEDIISVDTNDEVVGQDSRVTTVKAPYK